MSGKCLELETSLFTELRNLVEKKDTGLGWRDKDLVDKLLPFHANPLNHLRTIWESERTDSLGVTIIEGTIEGQSRSHIESEPIWNVAEEINVSPGATLNLLLKNKEVRLTDWDIGENDNDLVDYEEHIGSLREKLIKRIQRAERIMLAGAMGYRSVAGLLKELEDIGFQGEVDLFDISSRPLKIAEIMSQHGRLPEIKTNFIKADLTALEVGVAEGGLYQAKVKIGGETLIKTVVPKAYYDVFIGDVFFHYLSNLNLDRDMPVLSRLLKGDGLVVVTELEILKEVSVDSRSVGNDKVTREDDEMFKNWLKEKLGLDIAIGVIVEARNNQFSGKLQHKGRTGDEFVIRWFSGIFDVWPRIIATVWPKQYKNYERVFKYMVAQRGGLS